MPRSRRDLVRPPVARTPPAIPKGPSLYREPKDRGYRGPTAEPPPGFLGGTNSSYEWMIYHALAKVTGFPEDPRTPPFIGGLPVWTYQKAWDEGRRMPGGSVIDFVVYGGQYSEHDVAFRIQTEHFHIYTDMEQQMHDAAQFERLSGFMRVIDLYDHEFAFDPTNQAAIILIKDALAGRISPNPINDGTTMRVARMQMVSV